MRLNKYLNKGNKENKKPPDGRRKLNMQNFSVEGTVHLQDLKFLNTGDQIKEMRRKGQ